MEYKYGKNVSEEFVNEKLKWDSKYYASIGEKYAKLSTLKQKKCYVCSSTKSRKVSAFFGLNYLMCQKCGHVYTDRRLPKSELTRYYSEDQDYFNNPYTRKKIIKLRNQIFIPKIQFVKKYTKGKNWLDVGSADGTAVSVAMSEGFNAQGIEISKTGREFAKKHRDLNLYDKPLDFFIKENKTRWDVVSFFGVIEHLPDAVDALRQANKILKRNGIVAIEVPNYDSFSTYFQKLSKMSPDRHLTYPGHIMLFTKKSAEYMLRKNGFKPISIWFWGMDSIELLKYMQRLDRNFTKSELYHQLTKKLNALQLVFDEDEMGDEFLILGKKIKNL